jgi:hypothetical protein
VSGLHACLHANQISKESFNELDTLAFKLENGLLKLIQSLEEKRDHGEWIDQMMIKEINVAYGAV